MKSARERREEFRALAKAAGDPGPGFLLATGQLTPSAAHATVAPGLQPKGNGGSMKHTVRTETTKKYVFTEEEFKKLLGIEGEGRLQVIAFTPVSDGQRALSHSFVTAEGKLQLSLTSVQEGAEVKTP